MTDKQIIIDGVDVSGCDELVNECECYLTEEHDYRSVTPYTYNKCSGFPNCNYKKYKRKEQENEKLEEEIKTNGFGCFNIEMSEQLDQLKAENERLKQFENDANDILKKQLDLFDKKEQTLKEIKEIVCLELAYGTNEEYTNFYMQQREAILQKINECEVNNEV